MVNYEDFERYYGISGQTQAFSGVDAMKRRFPFLTKTEIEKFLASINSYTLHKTAKPIKHYNPHYIRRKRIQLSMDLVDIHWISEENDGITFLLILMDNFSRFIFVRPLLQKTGVAVERALRDIFVNDMDPPFKNLRILSDEGTEFKNSVVSKLLKKYKITLEHPHTNKISFIERVNLTIERLIYISMKNTNTLRYIDNLPSIVKSYNTRYHRLLRMSPLEAELSINKRRVITALSDYWFKASKRTAPKFHVGQSVRITKKKTVFARGYERIFTQEYFTIKEVHTKMPVPMYTLKEADTDEVIDGKFYENELTLYTSDLFNIVNIIEYSNDRKNVLIQKEGFQNPSWIKTSDLRQFR